MKSENLSGIRKHRAALISFAVCTVFLTLFTIALFGDIHAITVDNAEISTVQNKEYVAADVFGVMFVLREHNGHIAVMNSLESTVLEVLDISSDSLPSHTRAELDGGICITSISELVSVISSFENDACFSQE